MVLKGCGTIICGDDDDFSLCGEGNPGMASGGTGDALTGVIASLVGQGLSLLQAASLGVCWHACAGDEAARLQGTPAGILASDVISCLGRVA